MLKFLTSELFKLGNLPVKVWYLVVAVAVVVALILIIVACAAKSRRKSSGEVATSEAPVEPTQESEIQVDEQTDDQSSTDAVQEVADESVADEPVADELIVDEQPADEPIQADVDATPAPKKPTVKNYHVSLREDGKWQVKLSKGGKAIKLFATQAEAIAYAKALAKSQDGRITIHKVDGKIRKQKY